MCCNANPVTDCIRVPAEGSDCIGLTRMLPSTPVSGGEPAEERRQEFRPSPRLGRGSPNGSASPTRTAGRRRATGGGNAPRGTGVEDSLPWRAVPHSDGPDVVQDPEARSFGAGPHRGYLSVGVRHRHRDLPLHLNRLVRHYSMVRVHGPRSKPPVWTMCPLFTFV